MAEELILKNISAKLKDAVSWSNSNIAAKSEKALKYYNRAYLPGDEKIKRSSKWVSPVVQQHCDWLTAQLLHILDSSEHVVEFVPFGAEDEAIARQQTKVVSWILTQKNKHATFLQPWIQTGLLNGLSVVAVEFNTDTQESLPQVLKGVPNEQLATFLQQEEQKQIVIEEASDPYPHPQMGVEVRDLKIRTITKFFNPIIRPVEPENLIISRDAKLSCETGGIDAKLQGHRRIMSKQDLLDLGYDAAKVDKIPLATDSTDGVAIERHKVTDGDEGISGDDVEVYEIYTKLKLEKKARHYRLTLAGSLDAPVLLDWEETTRFYPYAAFVPFPIHGSLFSLGIPDRIGDEHVTITKMTRAILDDLYMHVHPIKVINPDVTNPEDAMNIHPGAVIRSSDPTGGISYVVPPFAGGDAVPMLQSLTQGLDLSTGVGPSMMSLNASDLQDVTATAANQRSNQGQLLIEGISRVFADSGYAYLVRVLIDQLIQHPEEAQALVTRLTNEFVPIDQFTPDFDVQTSVAFSVMSRDQSTQSLNAMLAQQMQLLSSGSPIVSAQNVYSTLTKLAEAQGFKNTAAFFVDPSTVPPPPPPPRTRRAGPS
ncbi:portal protein, partial [Mycoplana ramosa]|uniref:portal protein n=1 Tax=Mycoplana ramosa TaxID=40837 RepID=UPI0035BBE1A4